MRIYLFLALTLSITACSTRMYQPAATQPENTETAFHHGKGVPRAKLSNANITARLLRSDNKRYFNLDLFIRNTGDASFAFLPEEVTAYGYNKAGESRKLKVLTAQEEVRRRRRNSAIAAGVTVAVLTTAVIVAANADDHHHNDNPRPRRNDWDNDWWWFAASSPTVIVNGYADNPGSGSFQAPFVSPDRLLRQHTLYPEEALQGLIKIRRDPDFDEKILIEAPIEGQYAKFIFEKD